MTDDLALMGKFKNSDFSVSEVLKRGSIFILSMTTFSIVASKNHSESHVIIFIKITPMIRLDVSDVTHPSLVSLEIL